MTSLTSKISARLVTTPDCDLKVVNAARVSFNKESHSLTPEDAGLLRYLATHRHWTPFSHCRETFSFAGRSEVSRADLMKFFLFDLTQEDQASAVFHSVGQKIYVRHSIFGWANVLNKSAQLAPHGFVVQMSNVYWALMEKYPSSMKHLVNEHTQTLFDGYVVTSPEFDVVNNDYFKDVTMCETVPIFVARQRFKHMVGTTYNEVSRRYVASTPDIYFPEVWRGKHENKKQGSTDQPAEYMHGDNARLLTTAHNLESVVQDYDAMIANGVCPEQARLNLPQGMMTEYYVTAHRHAWNRFVEQRLDSHAQKEIQDLATISQHLLK